MNNGFFKLSALTVTSVGIGDLVYVADTADGGTTYASKKVTKANLFSGYATETYVGTQILAVDSAPGALDTLNELAAPETTLHLARRLLT